MDAENYRRDEEDHYENYRVSGREERRREKERDRRVNNAGEENHKNEDSKVSKQEGNMITQTGRSGGIYIPPFKLARMMKEIQDKSSVQYQRMTWDALRKSINGLVNKLNATNINNIIPELFAENLIRGRGLFCRSCMKSQMASPGFTDVFAALVAVVNTKFPVMTVLKLLLVLLPSVDRCCKTSPPAGFMVSLRGFVGYFTKER
nr:pre-mRNA-splicing factor CWC22 homolog [Ipomoea batatas]